MISGSKKLYTNGFEMTIHKSTHNIVQHMVLKIMIIYIDGLIITTIWCEVTVIYGGSYIYTQKSENNIKMVKLSIYVAVLTMMYKLNGQVILR